MSPSEPTGTANSWRDPATGELVIDATAWTGPPPAGWRLTPQELHGRFTVGQSRLGRIASIATGISLLVVSLAAIVLAIVAAAAIVRGFGRAGPVGDFFVQGNALRVFAVPLLALVGGAGLPLGSWILLTVGRLGMRDGPVLVIDDFGFEDRRTRRGKIAWTEIAEIRDVSLYGRGPDLEMLLVVMHARSGRGKSKVRAASSKFRILVQPLAIAAARLRRIMDARREAAQLSTGETSG